MSALKIKKIQLGFDADPLKNFTLRIPNVPDGSLLLSRGNYDNPGATILTINPQGAILLPDGTALGSQSLRNKAVNGGMLVDQRRNGSAVVANSGDFICDRFPFGTSQNGKWAIQRLADTSFLPFGHRHSAYVTISTPYASASGDYALIDHKIEGINTIDLLWGTQYAKPLTISFPVRSNVAGKYCVTVMNSAANRGYTYAYTIAQAGVAQMVSFTVPGDTAGTWLTDTNVGIWLRFSVGCGSAYNAAAVNTWGSTIGYTTADSVNLSNIAGAYWHMTGLQIEAGDRATSFEHRNIGFEEMLCKRYFEIGGLYHVWSGATTSGWQYYQNVRFTVQKRTAPTMSLTDVANNGFAAGAPAASNIFTDGCYVSKASNASVAAGYFQYSWTASAEL